MLKTCSKPNSWKYKFEITVQYYFPLSDIPFQWLQQFSDILTFLLSDRSFDKTKTVLGIFDSRINFHIWAMQQYTISSGNPRGKSFISKLLGTLNMNKSKLKTISFLNIVHTQCRIPSGFSWCQFGIVYLIHGDSSSISETKIYLHFQPRVYLFRSVQYILNKFITKRTMTQSHLPNTL